MTWRARLYDYTPAELGKLRKFERSAAAWCVDRGLDKATYRDLDAVRRYLKRDDVVEDERDLERERSAAWQYGGYTSGPWASLDVYEALDALPLHGERHIDGKCFRLVAGSTHADKLFRVTNRPCDLEDHFFLTEAVEFALRGKLWNDPGFRDPKADRQCELCDCSIPFKYHRGRSEGCTACGLYDLCSDCRQAHQAGHDADHDYSALPNERTLAQDREGFAQVREIVLGLVPAAMVLAGEWDALNRKD